MESDTLRNLAERALETALGAAIVVGPDLAIELATPRARTFLEEPLTSSQQGVTAPSAPSTAPPSRKACSRASSLATSVAPSRALTAIRPATFSSRTAAPSSWTKHNHGLDDTIKVVPDWVCEVLSPTTRRHDLSVKKPLYAAAGVSWLCLVAPRDREVTAFRLNAECRWVDLGTWSDLDRARTEPFDDVEFDLACLWTL